MRYSVSLAALLGPVLAALPGFAASATQLPDPSSAEAEVRRLEAELERARAVAAASRELDAARRDAEDAARRIATAEARLAAVQPGGSSVPPPETPVESRAETNAGEGAGAGAQGNRAEQGGQGRDSLPARAEQRGAGSGTQKFGGLEFGIGISFTMDFGWNDRVAEAELVNGIVRVRDENNGIARIMLESHYLFPQQRRGPFGVGAGEWGHGPFVALQPGTNNIIEAIGIGWMMGFRRPLPVGEQDTGQSFNIGLGIVVDPNTRILGDGIVANQPLPEGETSIRYKEEMQGGFLALVSFSF